MADTSQSVLTPVPQPVVTSTPLPVRSGFGNTDPNTQVAPAQSPLIADEARMKREALATTGDYVASAFRRDSLIPGIINKYVGDQFKPDPAWNPFTDKSVQEMQSRLWDQHKGYLLQTHSRAHAEYQYSLLRRKQDDEVRLGDMGVPGNIARIAGGFFMPDQILLGMASGGLGVAYRMGRVAAAGSRGASAIERATLAAETAARLSEGTTGLKGYAVAMGRGAAESVAITHELNKYNFDDPNEGLIHAGIMGAALGGAFHPFGQSTARRMADLAHQDAAVLRATLDAAGGKTLTHEQVRLVENAHALSTAVNDFHEGKITAEALDKRMAEATGEHEIQGPQEPIQQWMARYGERIRQQAQDIIDQNYKVMPDAEHQDVLSRLRGRADVNAAKASAEQARLEAHAARQETAKAVAETKLQRNQQFDAAAAENVTKGLTLRDFHDGSNVTLQGQMQAKLERAFKLRAKQAEQARREKDLATLSPTPNPAAKAASMDNAWAAHEAAQAAERKRQEEAAWTQRDVQDATVPDQGGVRTAVPDPTYVRPEDRPVEPLQAPTSEPAVHPQDTPGHWDGKEVSWIDKHGDVHYGSVQSTNEFGTLHILDTHGDLHMVRPERLDGYAPSIAPDGFIHSGSIGAAQHMEIRDELTPVSAMTSIKKTVTLNGKTHEVEVAIRVDYSKVFNTSPLESIRKLGFALVKDPTGFVDHATQRRTVSEYATELRRVHAGAFHFALREAVEEAAKLRKIPLIHMGRFKREFAELVSKVTRGEQWVSTTHADIIGPLGKASSAMAKFYGTMRQLAIDRDVRGAEFIPQDASYVTRMWDHKAIREAAAAHGWDHVYRLVGESIKNKKYVLDKMRQDTRNAGLSDEALLRKKGEAFITTLQSKQYSTAMRDMMMAAGDEAGVRDKLAADGMSAHDIDNIIDVLYEAKVDHTAQDSGRAPNLKHRFGLDEGHSVETQAGSLRLSDLLGNDSRSIVDHYATGFGAHIAFADHGFDSEAAWQRAIKEVEAEAAAKPDLDGTRVAQEIQHLQDVRNKIMGRPMSVESYNTLSRTLGAFQSMVRGASLAQLGITQGAEMFKAMATFGARNLISNLPTLQHILVALRQGYVPDKGMARDVMEWTGMGYETATTYFRAKQAGDGALDKWLTSAENFGNRWSHATNVLSGNDSLTSLLKHISAMSAATEFNAVARGEKKLTDAMRKRWANQGLDLDRQEMFVNLFKNYSDVNERGRLSRIRHEDWTAENPHTAADFQTFLTRQARDAIQDHDIGETMPWQHTPLGKLFGELKTFFLVGHAKNTLKQLHYMDRTSANIVMFGMVGEILAYSLQSAINHPDKLNERLQPDKIGNALWNRMAVLGVIPLVVETGYNVATGGGSLLQPGTTANTDNRSMLITPSMQFASKLGSAAQTFGGLIFGTDTATQKELRGLRDTIPLARYYGFRYLTDQMISTAPKADPEHPGR